MIESFFVNLSSRVNNENSLSDITWTLCLTSYKFKKYFISFFFKNLEKDDVDITQINLQREYTGVGGARPDFFFEYNAKKYLIECKLNDQNHHFAQYKRLFPDAERGYIANYRIQPQEGYNIYTWADFEYYLIQNLINDNSEEDILIGYYIKYLRSVCSIITVKKMKLINLDSLTSFIHCLKNDVIEGNYLSEIVCKTSRKDINEFYMGWYFSILNLDNSLIMDNIWIGITYASKSIYISIENYPRDNMTKIDESQNGSSFNVYEEEMEKHFRFELVEPLMDEFNNDSTELSRQKEILQNFFKEVVDRIKEWSN